MGQPCRFSGDMFTDNYTSANFNNKNVGTALPINVAGINLSGPDASNYTYNTTAITSADILVRPLTITATGQNKIYDSTTNGFVILSDNRVPGDSFTSSYTSAFYDNKSTGVNKLMNVTGINISGSDASNYSYNTTASALGTINPAPLTITGVIANNKVEDGSRKATLDFTQALMSGIYSGDYVTINSANYIAYFASSRAGSNIPVNVAFVGLNGVNARDYYIITPFFVTANILASQIIVDNNTPNVERQPYINVENQETQFANAEQTTIVNTVETNINAIPSQSLNNASEVCVSVIKDALNVEHGVCTMPAAGNNKAK